MNRFQRSVDQCPYRRAPDGGAEDGAACCGLLAEVSGVTDDALCRVQRDACEACCRSFPPSAEDINPVVASLLYQLSSRIAAQEGVPGCDRGRADDLRRLAVENLASSDPRSSAAEAGDLERLIPRPAHRSGPRIRRWALGVTTAPRRVPTLSETLASLARAGWERPRLFVDGDVAIPDAFAGLPQTVRSPHVGAWPNYYLALAELLMREPGADAYMLVQDDVLFCDHAGLRGYLERVLWPGRRAGIASLFCSRAYTQPQPGWYQFQGVWTWCALAFVFSREAAQRFLADREVVQHRWSRGRNGLADISWRVGRFAALASVPVYFPTPSLVQHIGDVSTLWKGVRATGNRRADWFAGDSASAE